MDNSQRLDKFLGTPVGITYRPFSQIERQRLLEMQSVTFRDNREVERAIIRMRKLPGAVKPEPAKEPAKKPDAVRIIQKTRTYYWPNDTYRVFHNVTKIHVQDNMTHEIELESGIKYYVAQGWKYIEIDTRDCDPRKHSRKRGW